MGFVSKKIPQLQTVSFYRFLLKILAVTAYIIVLSLIFGIMSGGHNSVENRSAADTFDKTGQAVDENILEIAEIAYNYSKEGKMEYSNTDSNPVMVSSAKLKKSLERLSKAKSIGEVQEISYNFADELNK